MVNLPSEGGGFISLPISFYNFSIKPRFGAQFAVREDLLLRQFETSLTLRPRRQIKPSTWLLTSEVSPWSGESWRETELASSSFWYFSGGWVFWARNSQDERKKGGIWMNLSQWRKWKNRALFFARKFHFALSFCIRLVWSTTDLYNFSRVFVGRFC